MMCLWNGGTLTAPTTSYSNTGGSGNRTAGPPTVSKSFTQDGGADTAIIDGNNSLGTTNGWDMPGTGSTAISDGAYIRFDFAAKKYIDEWKIYFGFNLLTFNMGAWVIEGSDTSGSGYTQYGSFTWDATTETVTLTGVPPEGYRYWQMRKNGAGSNFYNDYLHEVEFKIADGAV